MQKSCLFSNFQRLLYRGFSRRGFFCYIGEGTVLFLFEFMGNLFLVVCLGLGGVVYGQEGNVSDVIFILYFFIVIVMVLVVYDGMCYIYQCLGNVNRL